MRRVNVVFVAIVVGALLAGAVTATSFGTELRTIDTISLVEDQVRTDVTELRLVDQELRLTVELVNPTGYPIELQGTFIRVFQGSPQQLAYGAGIRTDDGPTRIAARGDLTAEYMIRLSDDQADEIGSAFTSGPVQLTVFHSFSLQGESFDIARTNVTVTGEVGS